MDIRSVSLVKLRPHPSRALVPPLTDEEFEGLVEDIRRRGVQVPLTVTDKNVILCGHHRARAAREAGLRDVPAIVLRGLDAAEQVTQLVLDNLNRRQLSVSQRAAILTAPAVAAALIKAYRADGKARQIAAGVHGSKGGRGNKRNPGGKIATRVSTRDRLGSVAKVSGKTIDHALLGWDEAPERMEAIRAGRSNETVSQVAHEIRRAEKAGEVEKAIRRGVVAFEKLFKLQVHDVWTFRGLDPGLGKKWPGNIPGSLVAQALYYFTHAGDLVVDPMAGGGVTGDVCRALGRDCVMADLHPSSKSIQKHDISSGPIASTKRKAALVFLDPPYWNLKSEDYGDGSPSGLSWTEWAKWLRKMATSAAAMAKTDGFVTCLMQDSLTRGVERFEADRSSIFVASQALASAGLRPVTQVACPLPSQQASKYDVEWARGEARLLGINRVMLVFRKA